MPRASESSGISRPTRHTPYVKSQRTSTRYRCKWSGCAYDAPSEQRVETHQKIHTAEILYRCVFPKDEGRTCGYLCVGKDVLRMHIKRHLGIKDKHCRFCEFASEDGSVIAKHGKRHHPDQYYLGGRKPERVHLGVNATCDHFIEMIRQTPLPPAASATASSAQPASAQLSDASTLLLDLLGLLPSAPLSLEGSVAFQPTSSKTRGARLLDTAKGHHSPPGPMLQVDDRAKNVQDYPSFLAVEDPFTCQERTPARASSSSLCSSMGQLPVFDQQLSIYPLASDGLLLDAPLFAQNSKQYSNPGSSLSIPFKNDHKSSCSLIDWTTFALTNDADFVGWLNSCFGESR